MRLTHTNDSIFTMHMASKLNIGVTVKEELHHTFVTYAEPEEKEMPNMARLISQPNRYYLHPIKDESAFHMEKFSRFDSEVDLAVERQEEVMEPALDLGTASLQRIVSQMKGLKFDVKEKRFNKDAAKLGGLKSYTEYISEYDKMAVSAKPFKGAHSLYKGKGNKKKEFIPGGHGLRGKSDIGDAAPLSGEKVTAVTAEQ
jgi:hypothetical protein